MNTRAIQQRVFGAMKTNVTYTIVDVARLTRFGNGVTSEALVALWQAGQVRTGVVPGTYARPA